MKRQKEIEAKVIISKKDFINIFSKYKLKLNANEKMTNYFFDTNEFCIFKNNAVFRVRDSNNKLTVTIKQSVKKFKLNEFNIKITKKEFTKIKKNKILKTKYGEILKSWGINLEDIRYQGFLTTHRWKIPFQKSTIVIDHCLYNLKEDWEIECESSSGKMAEKDLTNFCKENKINKTGQKMSKYSRFIFSLEQQGGKNEKTSNRN